jgi:hypothetical protein
MGGFKILWGFNLPYRGVQFLFMEAFNTSGVKVPQTPTLVCSFHHLRCQGSPYSYPCLKLSPPQVSRFPRLLPLFEVWWWKPQTGVGVWGTLTPEVVKTTNKGRSPQVSRFPRLLPLFVVFTTSGVKVPHTPTLVWGFHHLRVGVWGTLTPEVVKTTNKGRSLGNLDTWGGENYKQG